MAKHRWATGSPGWAAGRPEGTLGGELSAADPLTPYGDEDPAPGRRWFPAKGAAVAALGFALTAGLGLFAVRDWSSPEVVSVALESAAPGSAAPGSAAPGSAGPGSAAPASAAASAAGGKAPGEEDRGSPPAAVPPAQGTGPAAAAGSGAPPAGSVVVHVSGAVKKPGVVDIPAGSRLFAALEQAGGALPDADLNAVNLAAPVQDGSQIHVPRVGETPRAALPGSPATSGPSPEGRAALININTAGAPELQDLPRVGPVLAERIIEWRTAYGGFTRPEDLDAVPGIGPTMLEALLPLVTV